MRLEVGPVTKAVSLKVMYYKQHLPSTSLDTGGVGMSHENEALQGRERPFSSFT